MLRRVVSSSLQSRFLVLAVAAVLAIFGATKLRDMPMDALPEFAPPIVEVQTEALGLPASEVESLITVNLEELLSGVPWLRKVSSQSVSGLSSIRLMLEPGADVMRVRQMVQERLTLAYTLPNVSKPPVMLQPLSATSRIMMIGLSSKDVSLIQMSVVSQWTIKPKLLGVPGVANVAIWGERRRQLQVQIDPEQLRTQRVTQEQIISTSGDSLWVSFLSFLKSSVPGTGGWFETPQQRLEIRHVLPMSSADDLAKIAVDGTALRLGDVTKVVEHHPLLIGDAVVNDGPGLLLVVEKFPWANALQVTRGVEAALAALKPGLPGVEIDAQLFRPATFIELTMDNLTTALLIGSVLVVLVVGAFLFEWRVALISLVAIPLSLMAAVLVLYLRGTTINAMVLAGLAVALVAIIDDAIIELENIMRRLRQRRREGSDMSSAAIILEASFEIRRPILYATLIMLLAVTPVIFLGGLYGAFLKPLALSYVLALLASMVVALTVAPVLALMLLNKTAIDRRQSPLAGWLQRRYDAVFAQTMSAPRSTILATIAVALVGLAVWPSLQASLVPEFKERDILLRWATAPGTSHPETFRIAVRINRELRAIPGVRNVSSHMGRAVTGDQVVGINSGQTWVNVDPKADYAKTLADIQETVDGYPGIHSQVETYLENTIDEVLTGGASKPIVVRVFGPDPTVLRAKAEEVRRSLANIYGLVELQVLHQAEEPQVDVKVDLAAAGRVGLKPGDIRRAASTIFAGIEAGRIFEQQKIFEVVVWSTPEARQNLTSVRELLLETPSGDHVRLGDVAEVSIKPTRVVIKREAISNYVEVVADVHGRDLGSTMREVERRLQDVKFPLGFHAEVLGEYAERQAAQTRILVTAIVALIGIFLLLQASFRSWRLASAMFLALPVALVGGVLAASAGGGIVSIGSLAGLLAVLGMAARQGILLIHHYRHLEMHEGETFGPGLVRRGTKERLVPILASAIATALALLPIMLLGDIAGLEILRPMALVTIGGLVTSTLLVLLVVPALYLQFGSSPDPDVNLGVAQ